MKIDIPKEVYERILEYHEMVKTEMQKNTLNDSIVFLIEKGLPIKRQP